MPTKRGCVIPEIPELEESDPGWSLSRWMTWPSFSMPLERDDDQLMTSLMASHMGQIVHELCFSDGHVVHVHLSMGNNTMFCPKWRSMRSLALERSVMVIPGESWEETDDPLKQLYLLPVFCLFPDDSPSFLPTNSLWEPASHIIGDISRSTPTFFCTSR